MSLTGGPTLQRSTWWPPYHGKELKILTVWPHVNILIAWKTFSMGRWKEQEWDEPKGKAWKTESMIGRCWVLRFPEGSERQWMVERQCHLTTVTIKDAISCQSLLWIIGKCAVTLRKPELMAFYNIYTANVWCIHTWWFCLCYAVEIVLTLGPRQANLCLRAFRHDKF